MDNTEFGCFCFGILIGILIGVALILNYGNGAAAIDACEADIPRNESCVLMAVPEMEGGE